MPGMDKPTPLCNVPRPTSHTGSIVVNAPDQSRDEIVCAILTTLAQAGNITDVQIRRDEDGPCSARIEWTEQHKVTEDEIAIESMARKFRRLAS
jgi:hypothetical protein